ncbi:MAG: 23S rRNA (pseudouridine(1915)-N(3))-methyltransferase RlmH, partial [Pikeienuella sp.]
IEDKKRAGESRLLHEAIPEGAFAVALDERGETMTSRDFARLIAAERDSGRRDMAFLIGGADGHSEELRARADRLLGFGKMVWPHMLARAMLTEQLYRAASILAGAPYHRD